MGVPAVLSNKQSVTSRTQFQYSIGCDPELFVVDEKGRHRSAHDLVPGSKFMPFKVEKGAIQPDGTSAEFNIDCALSEEEFVGNIRSVLKELQATINEKNPKLNLKVTPVAYFDRDYFSSLPEDALAFGCTPDYNAWTDGQQTKFEGTDLPFRTGAGHIHIGWTEFENVGDPSHIFDCIEAVKQLDCILYPMSKTWDKDNQRRTLYGKMGAFRPKSYGVEYRPLSNAWLADPDLHRWIYRATIWGMKLLDDLKNPVKLWLDKDIGNYIGLFREGKTVYDSEFRALHKILQDFGMPELPPVYKNEII